MQTTISETREQLRKRFVKFYQENIKLGKIFTWKHFQKENLSKTTIYRIIRMYETRGNVNHKKGAGRPIKIMTSKNIRKVKSLNHTFGKSLRFIARKINCTYSYVAKVLKKNKIYYYKRHKAPLYKSTDDIKKIKGQCRAMLREFPNVDWILDDESYFTFSKSQMACNSGYYSSDREATPDKIKFRAKQKYEPKVTLYIAASSRGISKLFFRQHFGNGINQDVYKNQCLKKFFIHL